MKYSVQFPTEKHLKAFEKTLKKIPQISKRENIMQAVEKLASNPRPEGKKYKALKPPLSLGLLTASHRLRIGDFRVLYDIDENQKNVWIFELRKRTSKTY